MKKLPLLLATAAGAPEERADAARNRQKILASLREMLKTRAMREICMDELAERAGVGKGTLYRRFADRAALCLAILDEAERELQERILAGLGLPKEATASARLAAFFRALFEFVFDHAELLDETMASMREPSARFGAAPYRWRRQALLGHLARVGLGAEADAMADALLGLLDPGFVLFRKREGATKASLSEEHEKVLAVILRGARS